LLRGSSQKQRKRRGLGRGRKKKRRGDYQPSVSGGYPNGTWHAKEGERRERVTGLLLAQPHSVNSCLGKGEEGREKHLLNHE